MTNRTRRPNEIFPDELQRAQGSDRSQNTLNSDSARLAALEDTVTMILAAMETMGQGAKIGESQQALGRSTPFFPTSNGPAFGLASGEISEARTRQTFTWFKNCCIPSCRITASSKGCHPNSC